MNNADGFGTVNLNQAAFLMCHGFKLVGKQQRKDGKVVVILQGDSVRQKSFDYFNGDSVSARQFVDYQHMLKDFVLQAQRS